MSAEETGLRLGPGFVACVGVWDVFHLGHVLFLERAAALGGPLIAGVFADKVANELHRQEPWKPLQPLEHRLALVGSLRRVTIAMPVIDLDVAGWLRAVGAETFAVAEADLQKPPFSEAVEYMLSVGRRVAALPRTPALSTKEILDRYEARKKWEVSER